ncbi:MAG: LPS export ABC transporter periplasmic protein LptC [Pyrinomonadaceae bacterium]
MEKGDISERNYKIRANLPRVARYVALSLLAVTILIVIAGFYRERNKSPFKLKSEHTQLSADVVAEVSGYERLETDGGVPKYSVKADYAKTFADNHQELDNAYFEIYDEAGNPGDKLSGEKVLFVPEENKNFTAYLNGDVQIETRDSLKVRTNNVTYTKATEIAEADELVEFERDNVKGRSLGAIVRIADKRLELLKDVEIETFESPELAKSNVRYAKINAGSASFDQRTNKIEVNSNVQINIRSTTNRGNPQTTDINSERAAVFFVSDPGQKDETSARLKKFELFDHVHIVSVEQGVSPTNIDAGYALYDKAADSYELRGGTHIVTDSNGQSADIRASEAIFEQSNGKLALTGNAEITQGGEYLKGDLVFANFAPGNKIKDAVVRGNAFARQTTPERTTTVAAPELNAAFNDARQLQDANAVGLSNVEIIPTDRSEYTLVTAKAERGIGLRFKGPGLIDTMKTDGRTTIQLNAPNNSPDSANKTVIADKVSTFFYPNGKDIRKTEAVGNAELNVVPLNADKKNYRTTINAPRFDCDFFLTGNNAKACVAAKKAKAVRVPTITDEGHGTQTLMADQLTALFSPKTHNIETMNADGNAKFTELDRTAIAGQILYSQDDEIIRLRGGEPTVWDSKNRAKAAEIDWDTRNSRSSLRGRVSTTYYSRKQMGDSAPFASSDKPVFVTSDSAVFDHSAQTGVFIGNARGWQENNYVRGDKLFIKPSEGRFLAEGNVQSVLYNTKQKSKGKESSVPVFASSKTMAYDRSTRVVQYRENVDIRQGTDRLTSGSADVYLSENNELSKTVAETGVVITQPGRRATGNWVEYAASDEVATLRGSPASVNDSANGSLQASELTFLMRENRIISEGKTKQNGSGRIRSVYKIDPKQ